MKNTALLSLILLLSVTLNGCNPAASSPVSDAMMLPEALSSLSFEKHLEISIGYWNIDGMVKASRPDELQAYIESLFNISIQPVSVTWSNYKERYRILSATGSLPDVFATITLSSNDNNDSATFEDMIQTGSIRALPDDLSHYPTLENLLLSVPYTKYNDQHYYAIPRVSFQDEILGATDAALLVRRDWMDTLGIQNPESFMEFADMTIAFATQDPDGNGKADTIGYNVNNINALGKWVMLGIAPDCNVYSWIWQDGRYVPSWTTEAFEKVVSSYRYLYETGGLDPEFYTKSPSTVIEDFAVGRLGAIEYKSSPSSLMELKAKWDLLNDRSFEECVDVLPIFPAGDKVRYSNSSSIFWSESYISSAADEEKTERILALFEFLLSDQGQQLCRYGIEGIDYTKTDDGSYQCLLDTSTMSLTTALTQKYPSVTLFAGIATWGGGWNDFEENELNELRYGEDCVTLARESALWYQENTTQLTRPYAFLSFPKEPTNQFSTKEALEHFIACITGTQDPVLMWRSVLDQMYRDGLSDYIDRQNRAFNSNTNA